MAHLTVREILEQVSRGQIRIPAFQRGFVWEPDRVAYLMDSLYKGYPFGSLLFWRTKEQLKIERDLGPFQLPSPAADFPVDYVLDGQQRVTSIFGVFQTELKPTNKDVIWRDIYFDLSSTGNAQDPQFLALPANEVDAKQHFPLKVLFATVGYRRATKEFDDATAERIDKLQSIFKERQIPLEMFESKDRTTVALIFERVNRQGVPLDTFQLLSAWTWSEEFQLQEQIADLADELRPFGFADLGEDINLILRCCAAILTEDAAPEELLQLNGQTVRENFDQISNGLKYSVDFLRTELKVQTIRNLPFSTMLVPLAAFFAVKGNEQFKLTDEQRARLKRWFWRTAFSKRYSSAVLRNLNTDIAEMKKLREGASELGNFTVTLDSEFFVENTFTMGNVNTKTFILMLAQSKQRSFISGNEVDLAETLKSGNRTEFHHLMPRAFLKKSGQASPNDSVLANFSFLSKTDNIAIGGSAPSEYRAKLSIEIEQILGAAFCPMSLFEDDYVKFVTERKILLSAVAAKLIG